MNQDVADTEVTSSREDGDLGLGLGWSLGIQRRARGLNLRLFHPNQEPVEIEITISTRGPVIRASAAALEIEAADEIVARCDRFSIEARDSVSVSARMITHQASQMLRSEGGEVDLCARTGDLRVRANDDVQLLGEQILLNCDREPPLPVWVPVPAVGGVFVPRQDEDGDVDILDLDKK